MADPDPGAHSRIASLRPPRGRRVAPRDGVTSPHLTSPRDGVTSPHLTSPRDGVTSATTASVEKESLRRTGGSGCAGCLTFCFIGFVVVPLVLFVIGVLLGSLLLAVECPEAKLRMTFILNGTELVDSDGIDIDAMCSFYEWFKYVLGNMVALATPLTAVSPSSGHVVGEMLDLLISTWSVVVGGAFYGVIGALAFTSAVVKATEGSMVRRWQMLLLRDSVAKLAQDASGMDFDEFRSVASQSPGRHSDAELRALFDQYDDDDSGAIDRSEVAGLLASLEKLHEENEKLDGKMGAGHGAGSAQLDAFAATLEALSAAVQSLDARVASMDARLSGGVVPSSATRSRVEPYAE